MLKAFSKSLGGSFCRHAVSVMRNCWCMVHTSGKTVLCMKHWTVSFCKRESAFLFFVALREGVKVNALCTKLCPEVGAHNKFRFVLVDHKNRLLYLRISHLSPQLLQSHSSMVGSGTCSCDLAPCRRDRTVTRHFCSDSPAESHPQPMPQPQLLCAKLWLACTSANVWKQKFPYHYVQGCTHAQRQP